MKSKLSFRPLVLVVGLIGCGARSMHAQGVEHALSAPTQQTAAERLKIAGASLMRSVEYHRRRIAVGAAALIAGIGVYASLVSEKNTKIESNSKKIAGGDGNKTLPESRSPYKPVSRQKKNTGNSGIQPAGHKIQNTDVKTNSSDNVGARTQNTHASSSNTFMAGQEIGPDSRNSVKGRKKIEKNVESGGAENQESDSNNGHIQEQPGSLEDHTVGEAEKPVIDGISLASLYPHDSDSDNDSDIDVSDFKERTASLEQVQQMLDAGADIYQVIDEKMKITVAMVAAARNDTEIVDMFLQEEIRRNTGNKGGADTLLSQVDEDGYSLELYAVAGGATDVVRLLSEKYWVDFNIQAQDGITPLFCACFSGHTEIVDFLIEKKVNLNVQEQLKGGMTPLLIAMREGHSHIAAKLITAGANVNIPFNYEDSDDEEGVECRQLSALDIACGEEDFNTAYTLLKAGAGISMDNYYAIYSYYQEDEKGNLFIDQEFMELLRAKAQEKGFGDNSIIPPGSDDENENGDDQGGDAPEAVIGWLEKKIAQATEQETDDRRTDEKRTRLMEAAEAGDMYKIAVLVRRNPKDVDKQDACGITALMDAVYGGHSKIVDLLIGLNADVTLCREFGGTALNDAAINGDAVIVEALINAGAPVHALDTIYVDGGETALHQAARAKGDCVDCVLLLVNAKADLEKKDSKESRNGEDNKNDDGRTPLMWAVRAGNTAVVATLVKAKASLDAQDEQGVSVLESAIKSSKNTQVIKALVSQHTAEQLERVLETQLAHLKASNEHLDQAAEGEVDAIIVCSKECRANIAELQKRLDKRRRGSIDSEYGDDLFAGCQDFDGEDEGDEGDVNESESGSEGSQAGDVSRDEEVNGMQNRELVDNNE